MLALSVTREKPYGLRNDSEAVSGVARMTDAAHGVAGSRVRQETSRHETEVRVRDREQTYGKHDGGNAKESFGNRVVLIAQLRDHRTGHVYTHGNRRNSRRTVRRQTFWSVRSRQEQRGLSGILVARPPQVIYVPRVRAFRGKEKAIGNTRRGSADR